MANLSTHERQQQFISDNVDHLARAAYAGYRDMGRGVLVILPDEQDSRPGNLSRFQYHYMMPEELVEVMGTRAPNPAQSRDIASSVLGYVEEYDPSSNMVVAFLGPDDHEWEMNVYLVNCPTPPKLAYAAFVN